MRLPPCHSSNIVGCSSGLWRALFVYAIFCFYLIERCSEARNLNNNNSNDNDIADANHPHVIKQQSEHYQQQHSHQGEELQGGGGGEEDHPHAKSKRSGVPTSASLPSLDKHRRTNFGRNTIQVGGEILRSLE